MSEENTEMIENIKQQKNNKPSTKTNSYTYWVDQKNKSRQLPPQQRPQKIQATLIDNNSKQNENGRSQWNTAGTWQHKTISLNQVQNEYKLAVEKWIQLNCPLAKIKSIKLNGQCQIVFIRTKKALTYDINGKIQFQKIKQENKKEQITQQNKVQENNDTDKKQQTTSQKSCDSNSSGQQKVKNKIKKPTKSYKPKSFTFEIVQLTDHGDRQYKSRADQNQDKKFISQKSNELLKILEDILKKYK